MVTRSRSESGWYTSLFEMNKLFIIHKNRGSVYLKQKLCLSPIEVLFKINTGSIETELASARTNFFISNKLVYHTLSLRERVTITSVVSGVQLGGE